MIGFPSAPPDTSIAHGERRTICIHPEHSEAFRHRVKFDGASFPETHCRLTGFVALGDERRQQGRVSVAGDRSAAGPRNDGGGEGTIEQRGPFVIDRPIFGELATFDVVSHDPLSMIRARRLIGWSVRKRRFQNASNGN
jgi:hypothetical protein